MSSTQTQFEETGSISQESHPILVIGASGKVGSRITRRLRERGIGVRAGTRSADLPFDWNLRETWAPAIDGAQAVFVNFFPDLSVPGAAELIDDFANEAVARGVRRLVLFTGRGGPGSLEAERRLAASGAEWTVLRCAWFLQNFSEGDWRDAVRQGEVALPVSETLEPFIDLEDVADVACAVLTEPGHSGEVYELTGAGLVTFPAVVAEIAQASGRNVEYRAVPLEAWTAGLRAYHVPEPTVQILETLFGDILDGRNSHLGDGVYRTLHRSPRSLAEFAQAAATAGAWGTD